MRKFLLSLVSCFLLAGTAVQAKEHIELQLPADDTTQWVHLAHQERVDGCPDDGTPDDDCPCSAVYSFDMWVDEGETQRVVATSSTLSHPSTPKSLDGLLGLMGDDEEGKEETSILENSGSECILKVSGEVLTLLNRSIWTDNAYHAITYATDSDRPLDDAKWVAFLKEARVVQ